MRTYIKWLPIIGLVFDSCWLYLGPLLNLQNTTQGAFISELSATGQPYALLFRCMDIAAGLMWVIAASYLLRDKLSLIGRLLGMVLLTIGSGDIIDALLPLNCSETLSAVCRHQNNTSLIDNIHLYESCAVVVMFSITAITLLIALHFSKMRNYLYIITVIMLACMLIWLIDTLMRQQAQTEGYGYVQRLYGCAFIVWLTALWYQTVTQPRSLRRIVIKRPRFYRRPA